MKPTYKVEVWREDDWWLARVITASDNAHPAPLNALTQARALTKIEQMARDLIATILDVNESAFEIDVEYRLPDGLGELLFEAKAARGWLDAAQQLWQERSSVAARTLTDEGYSLREVAKLLDLSHQRVDQLLRSDVDTERRLVWAVELRRLSEHVFHWAPKSSLEGIFLLMNISTSEQGSRWTLSLEERHELQEEFRRALADMVQCSTLRTSTSATREDQGHSVDA